MHRTFGKISSAAKSVYTFGRKALGSTGSVAKMLTPYAGAIAKVSPQAAAAIAALSQFAPGREESNSAHAFKESITKHLGAASIGLHDKFRTFRSHPLVQGFTSSDIGHAAVRQVKNTAVDMATRMGISPRQQRNVVDYGRSFTAGIHKITSPPTRTRQYRRAQRKIPHYPRRREREIPVPNAMSQNIGLWGTSYFFHFRNSVPINRIDNPS